MLLIWYQNKYSWASLERKPRDWAKSCLFVSIHITTKISYETTNCMAYRRAWWLLMLLIYFQKFLKLVAQTNISFSDCTSITIVYPFDLIYWFSYHDLFLWAAVYCCKFVMRVSSPLPFFPLSILATTALLLPLPLLSTLALSFCRL